MATYLHPGVYIEEFTPGAPIQGVGIGVATKGSTDPAFITSWDGFQARFGAPVDETYAGGAKAWLAGSVKGFFENGGTSCWIVRASSGTFGIYDLIGRNTVSPVIVATALAEGPAGNSLTITVSDTDTIKATAGADLVVARASGKFKKAMMGDRSIELTAANPGFAPGDTLLLANTDPVFVTDIVGSTTVNLSMPLASNYPASSNVRIADLAAGQKTMRMDPPAGGKALRQLVSPGQSLIVDFGAGAAEFVIVDSVGADTITLRDGLTAGHAMTANVVVASADFDINVHDSATGTDETFKGVAMYAPHPRWFGTITSTQVSFAAPAAPPVGPITDPRPQVAATTVTTAGTPDDRDTGWANLVADPSDQLAKLAPIDTVTMVAIPGASATTAQLPLIGHCELLHDRVAILDPPPGSTVAGVAALAPGLSSTDAGFGALYYPWIQIVDPATKQKAYWPPSGHMAGVYARSDQAVGVWKAPANTSVIGAIGVEQRLTDADQDLLNPVGVNAFRLPAGGGAPRVWGARTTSASLNASWMYISIRRLFNYLEESIAEGVRWAVFEPNDRRLWAKLKRTITGFLAQAQRDGAIFGSKPAEGFYVRIDDALNPFTEQELGRLHVEIGIRPVFPAEFIVVRIGIWDGGSSVTEA
jgi:phage tail sheath protein FI